MHARGLGIPELLIVVGGCVFIFVLGLSAYFEPDIRWLHFFQAWMYVATIALSFRRNRWGYFIGISAAGFWDYINLFVTTFFRSGLHWLAASVRAGQALHVDQIIAVPAWIGNFLVLAGCIWAYARLMQKNPRDLLRFGLALVLTTAFFAADVALFQPRYLPLFRRALHPHSPLAAVALPPRNWRIRAIAHIDSKPAEMGTGAPFQAGKRSRARRPLMGESSRAMVPS